MNYIEQLQDEPIPEDFDITQLLKYNGPSFRRQDTITEGVSLLDYRNTDENEQHISILLSSQSIPFHIERPKYGWTGTQIRMIVTVPRSQCRRAESILAAAAKASILDAVEGTEGLYSY
jgi:hypothetical protein